MKQERLRVIWNKYYSESHGIVFVIDSANEARFQEAKETLRTWHTRALFVCACSCWHP